MLFYWISGTDVDSISFYKILQYSDKVTFELDRNKKFQHAGKKVAVEGSMVGYFDCNKLKGKFGYEGFKLNIGLIVTTN